MLYRGTEFVEAVTEIPDRAAYWVHRQPRGGVAEDRLPTRLLPAADALCGDGT